MIAKKFLYLYSKKSQVNIILLLDKTLDWMQKSMKEIMFHIFILKLKIVLMAIKMIQTWNCLNYMIF